MEDRLSRMERLVEKLIEAQARTDAQLARTDAQLARTDAQLAETDARMDRMGIRLANVGFNVGQEAEEYFYRTLKRNPKISNLEFDEVKRWVRHERVNGEIDILLLNGDSVLIIEVKFKAHPKKIVKIRNKKVDFLKKNFQQYQGYKTYFAIATLITNDALIEQSKLAGAFLLTQTGDRLEVLNDQALAY